MLCTAVPAPWTVETSDQVARGLGVDAASVPRRRLVRTEPPDSGQVRQGWPLVDAGGSGGHWVVVTWRRWHVEAVVLGAPVRTPDGGATDLVHHVPVLVHVRFVHRGWFDSSIHDWQEVNNNKDFLDD